VFPQTCQNHLSANTRGLGSLFFKHPKMPEHTRGIVQETPGPGKAKIVIVHMSIPNLINVMLAGVATIYGNSELFS